MFVLDTSVALAWCLPDEQNVYADDVLEEVFKTQAVVPILWNWEVVNGLYMAIKRGRIQEQDLFHFELLLSRLPIHIYPIDVDRSFLLALCQREDLTAYDAVYLALAMEKGVPLATLDKKLQKSARNNGIALFERKMVI